MDPKKIIQQKAKAKYSVMITATLAIIAKNIGIT
jgi:hypothetical protein